MASRTKETRSSSSGGSGTRKGIPASRILFFARTRRWLIAAGETRYAEAMRAASMPRIACNIRGVRAAGSIAGCAQTKRSFNRSSGKYSCAFATACASSAICWRNSSDFCRTCFRRVASIIRLRATCSSHASGFSGTPSDDHRFSAATNASPSASSAPATSPDRAAR